MRDGGRGTGDARDSVAPPRHLPIYALPGVNVYKKVCYSSARKENEKVDEMSSPQKFTIRERFEYSWAPRSIALACALVLPLSLLLVFLPLQVSLLL